MGVQEPEEVNAPLDARGLSIIRVCSLGSGRDQIEPRACFALMIATLRNGIRSGKAFASECGFDPVKYSASEQPSLSQQLLASPLEPFER